MHKTMKMLAVGMLLAVPAMTQARHRPTVGDGDLACDRHRWGRIEAEMDYVFHHMTAAEAREEYQRARAHAEKMRELEAKESEHEKWCREHAVHCERQAWLDHRQCMRAHDKWEEHEAGWHSDRRDREDERTETGEGDKTAPASTK